MRIKHTAKVPHFQFLPDFEPDANDMADCKEPKIGEVVEVDDALGAALIARGWGIDEAGEIVVERESTAYRDELVERARHHHQLLKPKLQVPFYDGMRIDALEHHISELEIIAIKRGVDLKNGPKPKAQPAVVDASGRQVDLEDVLKRSKAEKSVPAKGEER